MGSRIPIAIALTLALAASAGCGSGPGGTEPSGAGASQGGEAAAERAEQARLALVAGDLDEARRVSAQALQLDSEDPVAREVAARVALAEGRDRDVVEVLRDARRPRLVRLRARAHARLGEWDAALADLVSVEGREPADGWAEAVLPVARAAAGHRTHVAGGAERAELPMDARAPVPVVAIDVDGRTLNALVATSADLTVIDDDVRATPGLAGSIALGELELRDVPVLSRDLEPIGEALGIDLGAVVGTDLMLRLEATIDGQGRRVVFRRSGGEAPDGASRVPFVTFEGTFLAVPVVLDGSVEGWFTLDTSGLFPVALAPATVEALGLDVEELEPAPHAPSDDVRVTELDSVRFGQVRIDDVPAVTGLVPADLAELAGAPIAGMLGAALSHRLRMTLDPQARALWIH